MSEDGRSGHGKGSGSDGSSRSQSELDHHANQSNPNMTIKALMIITPIN